MPLLSPKRKVSDTENKVRILMCLDALGMASQEDLWPFVAKLEMMDYVPFCVLLDELRKTGAVSAGSHALEGVLHLTDVGHQQLELFGRKVLPTDRERIAKAAPSYRTDMSLRKQIRAAYELCDAEGYRAVLSLREGDVPTLFLRMSTKDGALVEKAVRGFHALAPQMLHMLYALDAPAWQGALPQAVSQSEAIAAAMPGAPALCTFGGHWYAAVVSVADACVAYTLLLLLPSHRQAADWACGADVQGRELAQALTEMILTSEVAS